MPQNAIQKKWFLNKYNREFVSILGDGNCCLSSMYSSIETPQDKILEAEKLLQFVDQAKEKVENLFDPTGRESKEDYFRVLISSFIHKVQNPESTDVLSMEYWGNYSVVILAARSMKKDVLIVNIDSSSENITSMMYYPYIEFTAKYLKFDNDMGRVMTKISPETIVVEFTGDHYNAYNYIRENIIGAVEAIDKNIEARSENVVEPRDNIVEITSENVVENTIKKKWFLRRKLPERSKRKAVEEIPLETGCNSS